MTVLCHAAAAFTHQSCACEAWPLLSMVSISAHLILCCHVHISLPNLM